ncbi:MULTISPECIES: GntR family transcriptional regulator [unclassified Exiguobacterium]|uniref:GntR family transcriptional regulator n=1 Tax=unclassified Exiguobacterium TaxID=2644629 RepID=UPI001BE814E2|nr:MULTISPECIES: GntR family transcriptional regulator [unclassified Exiguobacterium]
MLEIDKQSPLPIYYQIEAYLKQQIDDGLLKPGDTLPSEREFSEQFHVSRMTIRQAIMNLVNAGYLSRQKGRGTFVASQKIAMTLSGLTSFSEEIKHRGMRPLSRLLSYEVIPATDRIAQQLSIPNQTPVYEMKRLRLADDHPLALETAYIPVHLLPDLTQDDATGSIYAYAEQHGLRLKNATQTLEARSAGPEEAKLLTISPNAPVLLIDQRTYLEDGSMFEYSRSLFRGDSYSFTVAMGRI